MVVSFLLLVDPLNYCPHCGAAIKGGGRDRVSVPRWLIIATGAVLLIVVVPFLILLVGAWNDYQDSFVITFRNTTDEPLCFGRPPCPPDSGEIKPDGKSQWAMDSCFGQGVVSIYTVEDREIYSATDDCGDWDGALVTINRPDDEFIVTDDINATRQ
jgi:hypothetical protein